MLNDLSPERHRECERTGEKFDLAVYLRAQELCRSITERIRLKVSPGMTEAEGQDLIKQEFKKEGITKFWHPSKFRIGADTTKSFRELPDDSLRTEAGDLFFLDLGPIIDHHEADFGKTYFVRGDSVTPNSEAVALINASLSVWTETAEKWRESGLSGQRLYEFASESAKSKGFELNPLMAGHRLGDFPHALFSKEKLFSLDFTPQENLWVLEVHLICPKTQRGAFFEDILA